MWALELGLDAYENVAETMRPDKSRLDEVIVKLEAETDLDGDARDRLVVVRKKLEESPVRYKRSEPLRAFCALRLPIDTRAQEPPRCATSNKRKGKHSVAAGQQSTDPSGFLTPMTLARSAGASGPIDNSWDLERMRHLMDQEKVSEQEIQTYVSGVMKREFASIHWSNAEQLQRMSDRAKELHDTYKTPLRIAFEKVEYAIQEFESARKKAKL